MDDCCTGKACALEQLRERQAATLRIILILNAAMFVVELVAGLIAGSVALVADSLDMLGDALVYGFSLYVVGRALVWKVRAAFAKAAVMGAFGAFVLGQLLYKLAFPEIPAYEAMGAVGALALLVNGTCFALLWRRWRVSSRLSPRKTSVISLSSSSATVSCMQISTLCNKRLPRCRVRRRILSRL